MGFLDKAKAAANDLAAKADSALSGAGLGAPGGAPGGGDADRYFRDLGVLAYLEATGRAGAAADRERLVAAIGELEQRGSVRSFALQTGAPPAPGQAATTGGYGAPPPPGAATAPPPPPGAGAPPAPSADGAPPAPSAPGGPGVSVGGSGSVPPSAPPPPPPSWASEDR